ETTTTCPVCQVTAYCSEKHCIQDFKYHKKECRLLKHCSNSRAMQFLDVCDMACRTFFRDYMIPERKIGFSGTILKEIKVIDGKKYYCLKGETGMSVKQSLQEYLKNGFTHYDFWSIHLLGKRTLFHSSFVSAIRTIL